MWDKKAFLPGACNKLHLGARLIGLLWRHTWCLRACNLLLSALLALFLSENNLQRHSLKIMDRQQTCMFHAQPLGQLGGLKILDSTQDCWSEWLQSSARPDSHLLTCKLIISFVCQHLLIVWIHKSLVLLPGIFNGLQAAELPCLLWLSSSGTPFTKEHSERGLTLGIFLGGSRPNSAALLSSFLLRSLAAFFSFCRARDGENLWRKSIFQSQNHHTDF